MLEGKKGLYSRKSSIALLIFLALLSIISLTDIKYQYMGITGFAIDIFGDNQLHSEAANSATITVNTSQPIGIIREDFYGANTHGAWLGNGTKIDRDGDGIKESSSDLEWHRKAWLDSGMKMMRWDMGLEWNYAKYIPNYDFEIWNDSTTKLVNSDMETGADGWMVSSYGGGVGYVSRSSDAHSGNYSLKINTSKDDHLFLYKKLELKKNSNYIFSGWIKGKGNVSVAFQTLDNYSYCGVKDMVLNNASWQYFSIICKLNDVNQKDYRIIVEGVDVNEEILIDELNITKDGIIYGPDFFLVDNLNSKIEQLKWAHDNNMKVLLIASYMPQWLADTSIEGCDIKESRYCSPSNYIIWKDLVIDYLSRVTQDGLYSETVMVEVWNEPDWRFLLSGLNTDDISKATHYNDIYNYTFRLKEKYNNIVVGGPSLTLISSNNLMTNFLEKNFNKIDFFSLHKYSNDMSADFYNNINISLYYCALYGANCSHIILSEWNTADQQIKNLTQNKIKYALNTASGYVSVLNNWPANVSMILYQWSEQYKYSNTANYPEYPQKWNMVSEPGLDNEYTPAYNVTKNFAHFHAGGDRVVNSSSSNSSIKVVSSIKPNGTIYTTVISTASSSTPVYLKYDTSVYGVKNIETGQPFMNQNGIIDLGTFSQYDVKYFVEIDAPAPGDVTPPTLNVHNPEEKEYSSASVPVLVSINETGYCEYTLDSGKTNRSMSSSNARDFTASLNLVNKDYVITFYCFDMSLNRVKASVGFSVNVEVISTSATGSTTSTTSTSSPSTSDSTANRAYDSTNGINNGSENPIGSNYGNFENGNTNSSNDGDGRIVKSDKILEPQKGIIGRVVDNIEGSTGKSISFVIIIIVIIGILLFSGVAMVNYVNIRASDKEKYAKLKEWIGHGHSKGYEHDHLKEILLEHGWSEKMINKAIKEHKENLIADELDKEID